MNFSVHWRQAMQTVCRIRQHPQELTAVMQIQQTVTRQADTSDGKTSDANAEDTAAPDSDNVYKDGTYTGEADGYGGTIQVEVTLASDEITSINVVSAPGEDSAYLSQAESVIDSILSAQSTDVDTVSGATFSSTGILNAVDEALGKAENS